MACRWSLKSCRRTVSCDGCVPTSGYKWATGCSLRTATTSRWRPTTQEVSTPWSLSWGTLFTQLWDRQTRCVPNLLVDQLVNAIDRSMKLTNVTINLPCVVMLAITVWYLFNSNPLFTWKYYTDYDQQWIYALIKLLSPLPATVHTSIDGHNPFNLWILTTYYSKNLTTHWYTFFC